MAEVELWIIYRRIGTYIVPDIWRFKVPAPYQFMENTHHPYGGG